MKKSLTEAGREREREKEKRIAHKLFHKRTTTDLQLYFYISTLPFFKSFVLVSWTKRAYGPSSSWWVKGNTEFFPCVFFENWKNKVHLKKKKKMLQINVKEKDNQKPMTQCFVGKVNKILSTLRFE